MIKKDLVDVNWQTVFAVIPWVNLYASYRIKKLRLFLLLIIAIGVGTAILQTYILVEKTPYLATMIGIPFYIVFIRKWSKAWNEQFSKSITTDEII